MVETPRDKNQTKDQWYHLFTNLNVFYRVSLLSFCFFSQNFLYFATILQINKMSTENGSLYKTQYISALTESVQIIIPSIMVTLIGYRKAFISAAVIQLCFFAPMLASSTGLIGHPGNEIVLGSFAGVKAMVTIIWAVGEPILNQLIPTTIRSFADGYVRLWDGFGPIVGIMLLKWISNSGGNEYNLIVWMCSLVTALTLVAILLLPKVDKKESPNELVQIRRNKKCSQYFCSQNNLFSSFGIISVKVASLTTRASHLK